MKLSDWRLCVRVFVFSHKFENRCYISTWSWYTTVVLKTLEKTFKWIICLWNCQSWTGSLMKTDGSMRSLEITWPNGSLNQILFSKQETDGSLKLKYSNESYKQNQIPIQHWYRPGGGGGGANGCIDKYKHQKLSWVWKQHSLLFVISGFENNIIVILQERVRWKVQSWVAKFEKEQHWVQLKCKWATLF